MLRGHNGSVHLTAFSPDGTRVGGRVHGLDRGTGASVGRVEWCFRACRTGGHKHRVQHAAFGPDGTRVVTASRGGTARLWDASQMVTRLPYWRGIRNGSRKRRSVRTDHESDASGDGTTRLWDTASSEAVVVLHGHTGPAAFSPDGTRVVTASYDRHGASMGRLRR